MEPLRRSFAPPTPRRRSRWPLVATLMIVACLVFVWFATAPMRQDGIVTASTPQYAAFPSINTDGLTPTQQRLLAVLKKEYSLHASGSDATVMKYTEGYSESWCADFISWVMDQADTPYDNPNSGSWRVPGVLTLQDMYIDAGGYQTVGSYTPQLGDVAFYIGSQTPDGGSEGHVAIVLKVEGDMVTTIGGNEGETSEIKIRTNAIKEGEKGLVGFGISA